MSQLCSQLPSDNASVCTVRAKDESGKAQINEHFGNWPNAAGFNVYGEQHSPKELTVIGNFPTYVSGSLYRTGPGFYRVKRARKDDGEFACSHWFDGFTTMHKFDIESEVGGSTRINYTSRCQVNELVERIRETGQFDVITFGQKRDPCETLYQKVKSIFKPAITGGPRSMNVGVVIRTTTPIEMASVQASEPENIGGRSLTVTTDFHVTKQFDADTLETLGATHQHQLHPSLKGPLSASHAQRDPETGDTYNYNLEFGLKTTYRVFCCSQTTGETRILAEISGPDIQGAFVHSMFLTPNYLVLCLWPAYFTGRGAGILWQRNVMDALAKFDPSAKTAWLVVDRRNQRGLVKKFTSAAFFAFHTVNAWEVSRGDKGDAVDVFCELVQFENLDVLHRFYYKNVMSNGLGAKPWELTCAAHLTLYRLTDIPSSTVSCIKLGKNKPNSATAELVRDIPPPLAGDLPQIHPSYVFRPHRYVYSVMNRGYSTFIDAIGKTDTLTQSCVVWECAKHTPGEAIFVADPSGKQEDDGVLLSVVLDGEKGTSYLLCLNAKTMKEVARAEVGAAVGLDFHGKHIPSTN